MGLNDAVARYDVAVEHAERYAALYPKDIATPNMLREAYWMRLGLGGTKAALANLARLEALYSKDNPELAAGWFWMRHRHLGSDDERRAHAREYLERYGRTGGVARRIVVETTLGALLWRLSCKRPSTGVCADLRAPSAPVPTPEKKRREAPTCGPVRASRLAVFTRTGKHAGLAQRHMASAQTTFRGGVNIPEYDQELLVAVHDALGQSAVILADQTFEALLGLLAEQRALPATVPDQQLADLLARVERLARELTTEYEEVGPEAPAWQIMAAARIGQIAEQRAHALRLRKLPPTSDGSAVAARCAPLREQADVLDSAAQTAYAHCLELSIASGTFTDFSRLCEAALHERLPARYPRMTEIVGTAEYTASTPDTIGVQLEAPLAPGPNR